MSQQLGDLTARQQEAALAPTSPQRIVSRQKASSGSGGRSGSGALPGLLHNLGAYGAASVVFVQTHFAFAADTAPQVQLDVNASINSPFTGEWHYGKCLSVKSICASSMT